MKTHSHEAEESTLHDQAACWVVKRERGLSEAEQAAFDAWMLQDARHGDALKEQSSTWAELDRLAGHGIKSADTPGATMKAKANARRSEPRRIPYWSYAMGIAALLVLGLMLSAQIENLWHSDAKPTEAAQAPSVCQELHLEDGTEVQLNRGSHLEMRFTEKERRVVLLGGEAFFKVAKNAARPFVVEARGLSATAVGTAFNVCLRDGELEVLVSEGLVRVDNALPQGAGAPTGPLLCPGQAAIVPLKGGVALSSIRTLDTRETEELLEWRPRMMDFNAEPLELIVGEFSRRNHMRIRIPDAELGRMRLSASIRSDNVSGFLRLLDSGFGIVAHEEGHDLILRRKQ